jgi:MFS family permease
MVLGSFFDCIWILASIIPAMKMKYEIDKLSNYDFQNQEEPFYYHDSFVYFISFFTAVLGGMGESVQWVSQGKYISDCATDESKGFFFGYFWAFYNAAQIFGSIFAALVFLYYDVRIYYLLMSLICLISCVIFYSLKSPEIKHGN